MAKDRSVRDDMVPVDQRSQLRIDTNEPVFVTLLGESEIRLVGRITNYSHQGMGLHIREPAPIGGAVKIEWGNVLLLGDVCHCQADREGFAIGLWLEHALYNMRELIELARRLLDESPTLQTTELRTDERNG
ncbi:MAG TPA: hypothetical protein VGR71_01010 [Nitrospira sp.]|nr:hypothetical protein [Nitrospira sp.]